VLQERYSKDETRKEIARKRSKDWYHNNREKSHQAVKRWLDANPSHRKEHHKRVKRWDSANSNKRREYGKRYRENRENKGKISSRIAKRRAMKLHAVAAWINYNKVEDIYNTAKMLSDVTGILHHVDHIVPLQSNVACGLHCEDNLRVITAEENLRKGNTLEGE